ncbi:MAG: hypothetical protein AB1798_12455 [Spirochaetota bacterium]
MPEGTAVTDGTYGLVRHPGFLWFFLFYASLGLILRGKWFFFTAFTVNFLNFLLILVEDTIIFPKLFINYREYQKTVPFLFPGLKWILKKK